jgi:hypothetical protein
MDCRITVESHLDPTWSDWFDGMTITNLENGRAVLTGPVTDQAALHGVLAKIRDLGLPMTEVRCQGQSHGTLTNASPQQARGQD